MIASVCEQYQLPPEKVQSALIGAARASNAGMIVLLSVIFITSIYLFSYTSFAYSYATCFSFFFGWYSNFLSVQYPPPNVLDKNEVLLSFKN